MVCNMQFFWQISCAHVLTDLLDTSCQYLHPTVNIAMSSNFKHCHVYNTLDDFLSSKVRFIHTSTDTGRLAYILLYSFIEVVYDQQFLSLQ